MADKQETKSDILGKDGKPVNSDSDILHAVTIIQQKNGVIKISGESQVGKEIFKYDDTTFMLSERMIQSVAIMQMFQGVSTNIVQSVINNLMRDIQSNIQNAAIAKNINMSKIHN